MRNGSIQIVGAAMCGASRGVRFGLAAVWLGFGVAAQAADRYWVSPSNSVWSLAENWSEVSGGVGGVGVPGPDDVAIFDAGNLVCQVDVALIGTAAVAGLWLKANYTGHFDGSGENLDVYVSGNVTLAPGSGGVVSFSGNTWTIGGNFSYSSMTSGRVLNSANSTVVMTGSNVTISATYYRTLNNLVIDEGAFVEHNTGGGGGKLALSNTLEAYGRLNTVGVVEPRGGAYVYAGGAVGGTGLLSCHYSNGVQAFDPDGVIDVAMIEFKRPSGTPLRIAPGFYNVKTFRIHGETYDYTWALDAGRFDIAGDVDLYQYNTASDLVTFDCAANSPAVHLYGNLGKTARVAGGVSQETYTWQWTGAVTLAGTNAVTADIGALKVQPAITIDKPLGSVKLLSSLTNTPALNVSRGTIDFNGQAVRTAGDFTVEPGGQFVAAGLAGSVIHVGSNLTFTGSAETRLDLAATGVWTLAVGGEAEVRFANVANADASGGSEIVAWNCRDLGGNIHWRFIRAGTVLLVR